MMSHLPGVLFFWKDPERPIDMILLQSDQSKSFGKEEHLCYWEIRLTGIAEDIILSFNLTLRFSIIFITMSHLPGVLFFWKDPERPIDMILLQSDQSKSFDNIIKGDPFDWNS
ncbi:hypothetical protein PHYBLDRAFT_164349 [Phycomyces blakesleeanus NRRL 1555(-)]|uniref:Uncharacterized protein n=1 Tax=Phycomyces blakesleeanus (strain ATCC 8743b / DSM 1359 / FGSC 10004 / NBRC 33097 / NRRL 1555) TaxID=763407 RepID=A0A167P816_PHYB8|nr:hypothetical protein PHYBLDRAFT_164349 [Phycomyces blakesleeanus NRRL 1555(-)]OAD77436.1 hypothetical protein PHYBLDRAFT_164349 [Phycomyces blakesleeanus NRRL 1555(-)]|eukprot:XP_018295476.1 hypothetical protein PHYBLDRAFT_164349 [Phycomyces blakesleeanus NRRL 1555(-)]